MDFRQFLVGLTVILCTAGVTTVVFQRLRLPVVLGYLLAGFILGPHVPIPLVADRLVVQALSELGVILLMFSLGLEFSVRRLFQVGPTAGLTAIIQSSIMMWLGYAVGQAFGWTALESLFCGALIAISSTTIIAKAFDEQGVKGKLRELVVGVLIVEDLIAIVLMAALTTVATGHDLSAQSLLMSAGRLAAFLAVVFVVGLLMLPRAMRIVRRINRPETTLVASVGICFAVSLLAHELGYSVALGAFLAGSLIAESREEKPVEHVVLPVRDLFAAIFFVSVGMLFDPAVVLEHWSAVGTLFVVVVVGKLFGVAVAAFLTGNGTRTSVQAGLSLAQIGEFSFIIAGLGLSLGATRAFLYPVAIAVSALTTLTTPFLIRAAGPIAAFVDDHLPRRLSTFAALYGSWIERFRHAPREPTAGARNRRLVKLLALDATLLGALLIGAALSIDDATALVSGGLRVAPIVARSALIVFAALILLPFAIGVVRIARRLGLALADAALPRADGERLDLAAAPRRALVVTHQLAVVLVVALPLLALTRPFVSGAAAGVVLVALMLVLGMAFWRSTTNLAGHLRAGTQVIVDALIAQTREGPEADEQALQQVRDLLPGIGEPVSIRLTSSSAAVGRSLEDLQFRSRTGAAVLALVRHAVAVHEPRTDEPLLPGDLLAVAGTQEAIAAARALLLGASRQQVSGTTDPSAPASGNGGNGDKRADDDDHDDHVAASPAPA